MGRLYADLARVRLLAEEEGDGWTGLASTMIEQALSDVAARAEMERRRREDPR